jgi:hypothetical protein
MRNTRTALWAAVFAAGVIGVGTAATGQDNPPGTGAGVSGSVDKSGVHVSGGVNPPGTDTTAQPLALPKGFSQKDINDTDDIKKSLASMTEDAVTKDKFDSVIGYLAKPDEKRIKDEGQKNRDVTTLNGRIAEIQKDWKAKYNTDFDVDKAKVVFNEQFKFVTGEVSDEATALANWPVPATTDLMGQAREAAGTITGNSNKTNQTGDVSEKNQGNKAAENEKLDTGRNVAVMQFPASHGLPTLNISMIHQLPDNWRVDIPNDRTGEQIYQDLLTHLTYADEHKDQWPSDVNDGYRMFAHHVLMALYGVPMNEKAMGSTGS